MQLIAGISTTMIDNTVRNWNLWFRELVFLFPDSCKAAKGSYLSGNAIDHSAVIQRMDMPFRQFLLNSKIRLIIASAWVVSWFYKAQRFWEFPAAERERVGDGLRFPLAFIDGADIAIDKRS